MCPSVQIVAPTLRHLTLAHASWSGSAPRMLSPQMLARVAVLAIDGRVTDTPVCSDPQGLITTLPKLKAADKQHTYVETENVRCVLPAAPS